MRYKNLQDIYTFSSHDGEVMLSGKDEEGDPFTIVIPAYEFYEWIDMDYIREKLIEHIKGKKK